MSVYDRDFTKMNARAIARECSPVHIENVLKAAFDEIALLNLEKQAMRERLRRVDHTLCVHGHIDAGTDLHNSISFYLVSDPQGQIANADQSA
jgi:hypothetical protein